MRETSAAPGEPGGMPNAVAAALREIGARIEPARTAEIYVPLHSQAERGGSAVRRDIAYGPHERNVLDVFTPAGRAGGAAGRDANPGDAGSVGDTGAMETGRAGSTDAGPRPVLVFVHGGGFQRGAKTLAGLPFYDNVMHWAIREGMVGVNINYRLAPEHRWPSGIEDLTGVVTWLETNVAAHGGDPARVYLWGHSAGAAHVADYVAWRTLRGDATGAAGAILTSGFYALGDEVSPWRVYYGDDVASYAERSSLAGLVASDLPLLVNDAELDPEHFHVQSRLLAEARSRAGKPVRYLRLAGHSHISETYAIGTADTTLSGAVGEFVRAR